MKLPCVLFVAILSYSSIYDVCPPAASWARSYAPLMIIYVLRSNTLAGLRTRSSLAWNHCPHHSLIILLSRLFSPRCLAHSCLRRRSGACRASSYVVRLHIEFSRFMGSSGWRQSWLRSADAISAPRRHQEWRSGNIIRANCGHLLAVWFDHHIVSRVRPTIAPADMISSAMLLARAATWGAVGSSRCNGALALAVRCSSL